MTDPVFGIKITRSDNEPRFASYADMSVVGIIGTGPDADADVFPLDTPVTFFSNDAATNEALGGTGTIADAIGMINSQLGDFQVAARLVVVRVAEGLEAATISNIVGNGTTTGLAAFLSAGPTLGVIPRILLAPGFTHQQAEDGENPGTYLANPVCAALPSICTKLLAHAIVTVGPASSQAAVDARETLASERLIPIGIRVKVSDGETVSTIDAAPAIAGIAVRRDYEKNGLPFWSWANQAVQGIVGLERYVGFSLTDGATEGQTMLAANVGIITRGEMGVESALSSSGYIFVGTDNAGTDDLWRFYNVTRGRDFIHLQMLKATRTYLGQFNITSQTIQAVLNTIGIVLRDLKSQDAILGYRVSFTADRNSPENLRAGKISVTFEAEEAPVLRRVDMSSARYRPALEALVSDLVAQAGSVVG